MSAQIAPLTPAAPRGIVFNSIEVGHRLAVAIVKAGMQPKSFGQGDAAVAACFVAMQAGAEIGLSPMAAIQNIAVINGKPGIYGPAALGLVRASGHLQSIHEEVVGDGDRRQAQIHIQRRGEKPRVFTFSITDAKRARLWGKQGPWSEYPDRMLLARARGFALRDVFPDVLLGCHYTIEELTGGSVEAPHDLPAPAVSTAPPRSVEPVEPANPAEPALVASPASTDAGDYDGLIGDQEGEV